MAANGGGADVYLNGAAADEPTPSAPVEEDEQ